MKKIALLLSIFALFVTVGITKCEAAVNTHVIEISEKIMPQPTASADIQVPATEETKTAPRSLGDWQSRYKVPNHHPADKTKETLKNEKPSKGEHSVNDYSEYPAPAPAYVPNDPDIAAMEAVQPKCCEKCACNPDCTCGENCTCDKKHKCSRKCDCKKAGCPIKTESVEPVSPPDVKCKCEKKCKCGKRCKCDKAVCKCKKCNIQEPEPVAEPAQPVEAPAE